MAQMWGKGLFAAWKFRVDHPSGIGGNGATLIDKLPLIGLDSDILFIPTMR